MTKNKKKSIIDIGRIMEVEQDDVDRIAGGMIRLETTHDSWTRYIKRSLKLAKNDSESCLVWYFIGYKSGFMNGRGIPPLLGEDGDISSFDDPNIQ